MLTHIVDVCYVDGLVQERRYTIAYALVLRFFLH